jgi:hypothetical protein
MMFMPVEDYRANPVAAKALDSIDPSHRHEAKLLNLNGSFGRFF